jgi:hypothetical protein
LSNSGTTESIFAFVTDPIPTNSTFTSNVSGGGEYVQDVISYSGTLSPLHSHTIEFEVKVNDNVSDTVITNTATITSREIITGGVSERLTVSKETIILPCLSNGDFEDGWTGWIREGDTYLSPQFCPSPSKYCALLGDPTDKCWGGVQRGLRGRIKQSFCVPPIGSPKLYFWYRIFTNDTNENLDDEHDRFDVKINGVQQIRDMRQDGLPHCNDAEDLGGTTGMIDLSGYKGSYITIQFEVWNEPDMYYNTWVYIDNVRIVP